MKTFAIVGLLLTSLIGSAIATAANAGTCSTTCQRYGNSSNCTTHCY